MAALASASGCHRFKPSLNQIAHNNGAERWQGDKNGTSESNQQAAIAAGILLRRLTAFGDEFGVEG
jgi:hypothetical protein